MEKFLLQLSQRAETYKILAECHRIPDQELLEAVGNLDASDSGLEHLARTAAKSDLAELLVDHAGLFIGPYKLQAPPYGSVYLEDGVLMGNSTMNAEYLYFQEGMEASGREAPDHITAELEFMYVLIGREIEAVRAGDVEAAGRYRQKQNTFLGMHLGAWIAEFTARVKQRAQTEFYRTLADVAGRFVAEDLKLLPTNHPGPQNADATKQTARI